MPETAQQIDNIMFRMEVPNRENRKNGQESIEFSYNLETDVPENVVDEMVSSLFHVSILIHASICLIVCPLYITIHPFTNHISIYVDQIWDFT